jgi:hypothetical protein
MKAFCFAVLALLSLSAPARAECTLEAKVRSDIIEFNVAGNVSTMAGAEKDAFLASFNAMPPVSDLMADKILIIEDKDKPNAVIVLFDGDCATRMISVRRNILHQILRSL